MGKNEFNVRRIAFGNVTFPANTSANTASTISASANVYIPKGAIVTGIRYFALGALTNVSALKNATINPSVGGIVLGTNNLVGSTALTAAVAYTQALAVAGGVYLSAGGNLLVNIASSDSDRIAVAGTFDIYVEYLYCDDRDLT
jgi:hypothetical protein